MAILLAALLTAASASAEVESDVQSQAREHFNRGAAAFDARRFGEAAKEFQAAYELTHSYQVLYNIGQVAAALGQAVDSVDALQAYLDQGGNTVPEENRAIARAELERQRALIGTISVRANPAGASVHIDGKLVGKTPLTDPVRVTAGKHSVMVLLEGYEAQSRDLQVAAGAQSELDLTLQSNRSTATPMASPPPVVVVSTPGHQTSSTTPAVVNVQVPRQPTTAFSAHQRTAGYVLGGLGVAVAAVGTYIAVSAFADARNAKDQGDADAFDSAKNRSYWGWGTIAAGGIIATTGFVLVVTGPSNTTGNVRLSPFTNGYAHGLPQT